MTTTTVIAKDTSSAMDDIMSKLGDDAVILSTKHKDGKVHMTATTENVSTTPRRLKPSQQFSKIFESRMLNDQFLNQDKPLELEEAFNDTGASTAQLSALRTEIQEIKNMLSGVVVTEPQNLNDNIASTSALKLRQSGFSPKVVKRLEKSFLGKDFEGGRVSFLRSLAKTLVPNDIENLKDKQIFYIIGPSGSGKTTLAAKLAALLADTTKSNSIILSEINNGNGQISDSLRGYARLLNLKTSIVAKNKAPEHEFDSQKTIVDVSTNLSQSIDSITSSKKIFGHKNVCVIMAVPGGSSNKLIESLHKAADKLEPMIALCKLDECEIGPEEFSKLSELDSKIGIITGTNNIVGSLAVSSENIITQYLKENC